jgi:hypothetical protein
MTAIRRLGEQEAWEKIAIPAKLVSDILGFTKDGVEAPVFANLTQKDIDDIRARVKAQQEQVAQAILVVDGSKPAN